MSPSSDMVLKNVKMFSLQELNFKHVSRLNRWFVPPSAAFPNNC